MKKNISKFDGIVFPFFGLKHKPHKILYDVSKIYVVKYKDSHKQTLDDKSLSGDYFNRLLQLENRVKFDYTCKNLQDIVYSSPKWGVDVTAKPFDLSKKQAVATAVKKVKKSSSNLIWVDSISYPFRLNTRENLEINDSMYATLIKVNNEWFIREFTMDAVYINSSIYI